MGKKRKDSTSIPSSALCNPYIPHVSCFWHLSHSVTLHSKSNYSLCYPWLTRWSKISCISLTLHSYFSCRNSKKVEAIPHTPSKHWTMKLFCYWSLNLYRVARSLLSFSYTAFILTSAIKTDYFLLFQELYYYILFPSICTLTLQRADLGFSMCLHTM